MSAETPSMPTVPNPPKRLDLVLPASGLARSRSHAAELIAEGRVTVDGETVLKAAFRVQDSAILAVAGLDHYVSRAAHKLIGGLDAFGVDPEGRVCLDVGASTGGFTQVLLERGAALVFSVDVGHDQFDDKLAIIPRVHLVEGYNARNMTMESLTEQTGVEERPSLIVADLSFISLPLVLPAMAATAHQLADFVLLIKPQFEVGRTGIKEGIVHDPIKRADAITGVLWAAWDLGLGTMGIIESPIAGGAGNREYVVHFRRDGGTNPTEWLATANTLAKG